MGGVLGFLADYRWVITRDHIPDLEYPEGTNMNAKGMEGPHNLDPRIKANGARFALYDDDDNCYYQGMIYGDFVGNEPLYDFGHPNAGCSKIRINGRWLG